MDDRPLTIRTQEIIDDFRRLTAYSSAEITSIYSFGEPDFDPTATKENAGLGLIDRYAKLTGLSFEDATKEIQDKAWYPESL